MYFYVIAIVLAPVFGCPSESDPSLTDEYLKLACWQQILTKPLVMACKHVDFLTTRMVCDIQDDEDYREFACKSRGICKKLFMKVCYVFYLV